MFFYIIIVAFQNKGMSHLKIREVQVDTLAPYIGFDIICCSVLKNLLKDANVLRKQNCISCSCYRFSLKMAYTFSIFKQKIIFLVSLQLIIKKILSHFGHG